MNNTATIDSIIMPRVKLEVIFSMAISKREKDEENLPGPTTLLTEMKEQLSKIRKGKHIVIV